MKKEIIKSLTSNFESYVNTTENGVEFWFARDLQKLLGYSEWRNFSVTVVEKAKIACDNAGLEHVDHFVDGNKMIQKFSCQGMLDNCCYVENLNEEDVL